MSRLQAPGADKSSRGVGDEFGDGDREMHGIPDSEDRIPNPSEIINQQDIDGESSSNRVILLLTNYELLSNCIICI